MDRILNWAPQEDFAIRLSDQTALPRTEKQLNEMCEKINAIANEYDFKLSCFGGWTGLRIIAIDEDRLFRELPALYLEYKGWSKLQTHNPLNFKSYQQWLEMKLIEERGTKNETK